MSGQVLAHVGEIQTGVDRVNALVLQLRRFHALRTDELTLLPLNAVVGDAVRFFRTANPSQRTIAIDLQDAGEVRLHPLGIHQIVINLLGNATDATEAGTGRIAVRTYREGAAAYLEVEDNGVGMDAATAARAFDPLFSTKRDGMGLGLHIVRRIAEAHEGDITLRTAPGQGTTFRARFPIADAPALVAVRVDVGEPASRPAPMV